MDFKEKMKQMIAYSDNAIEKYIPSEKEYPQVLFESMRYSVFAGGKRLRPMFLFAACEALGGNLEEAAPFACAIEMIHTYSLIHDDLPALDNDDYRRGRLTSHKVFGEDMAILCGDALLSQAFELMADTCCNHTNKSSIEAMRAIAHGAGTAGMVAGQVVDVKSEGQDIDAKTLDFIHKNKTAAMIQAALKAGAFIGGANKEEIDLFDKAGEKIGIAFQIQDDILDVVSTKEVLGKPIHSDEKNQKVTYVTMYGLEESKKIVEKLSNEAMALLENFGEQASFLVELTKYLIQRSY